MRNFGFNDMSDEEFRREFMKFLTTYQSGLENYIRETYNNNKSFKSNPFLSAESFDNGSLMDLFKGLNKEGMDTERGINDDDGEWEKRSWQSPDGSSSFSSFSKNYNFNPFDGGGVTFGQNPDDISTIKLLEGKLKKSIIDENYENASKIRDLINNLKEDINKDK